MTNGSKYWFIRIDVKADANYREPTELLLINLLNYENR